MNLKHIRKTFAALLLAFVFTLSGCASDTAENSNSQTNLTLSNPEVLSSVETSDYFKAEDTDSSWSEADSTLIALNQDEATITGSGASFANGVVTISSSGTYVLSGKLLDGQILIDAGSEDLVRLVLNGVSISCSTSAAIYEKQSDKLVIILADGSENTVSDCAEYVYADGEDEPNAAVFAKHDLSITGLGSLNVTGNYKNAIGTKDDLRIASGNITASAANDAIRGKDSVVIADGTFILTSQDDAIRSNCADDAEMGYIVITGGTFSITAGNDGIDAETTLQISGGTFNILTGGGSAAVDLSSAQSSQDLGGRNQQTQTTTETTESMKGIKSGGDMIITGGTFTIDSEDDSVHSNGSITITNGSFTLSTGDDGIHTDIDLVITGGEINVLSSYEGLEGSTVNISGGTIKVVAVDDGINAAGGDGDAGFFGADFFGGNSDSYSINISGGTISVVVYGGDGFDSNGSINITGGYIVSLVNSTSDNEAMDCDSSFSITNATAIYGGTNIGKIDTETQSYVYLTSITAGQKICVLSNGTEIVSFTPEVDCGSLIITSPDIIDATDYEITVGGTSTGSVTAGVGASEQTLGGNFGGDMGKGGNREETSGEAPTDRQMPDDMQIPEDGQLPGGQMPDGMQPPTDGSLPSDRGITTS